MNLKEQAKTSKFTEPDDQRYFALTYVPTNYYAVLTTLIERAVIRKAVQDILAAGCEIEVHDGEDTAVHRTSDFDEIMDGIMSVDEDTLFVFDPDAQYTRFISLVYGNDGYDVIADNSLKLEPLLAGATALAGQLEDLT